MNLPFLMLYCVTSKTANLANDGWAVYLGGEQSLRPHPSIRMVKEFITIDVGDQSAWVTCTFWFKNEGAATSVEMAYPDESPSTWDGQPSSQLREFRSWVDGSRVATKYKIIRNGAYQVKRVQFGKLGNRTIVNRSRIPLGSVATIGKVYLHDLHYTFSTGASWKGNIGRTELITRFIGRFKPQGVIAGKRLESEGTSDFWSNHADCLFANGPEGELSKNEYRIIRRNWRPAEDDNLQLKFRPFKIDWSRGEQRDYLDTP